MLKKAFNIANTYHSDQVDKAGRPYILHPIAVYLKAMTEDEKIVAILHDVVEDTIYTEEMLRSDFPEHVANAVMAVTKREGESYTEFILRAKENPIARAVKGYDMEHNMSSRGVAIPDSLMDRYVKHYKILKED
jgi:(p)ppGpp synthase/HD superfamily hydrolase